MNVHKIKINLYDPDIPKIEVGTQGSYGVEAVDFELGPEWDGLTCNVSFLPAGATQGVSVIYTGTPILVPSEVMAVAGHSKMIIDGVKDNKIIKSKTIRLYVSETMERCITPAPEPTPSTYAQVVDMMVKQAVDADAAVAAQLAAETAKDETQSLRNETEELKDTAVGAAQTATEQADRAEGIADTFENTTLPAAIQSVEQAVEEQIGIAKGHADRAQELADTFEQTTLPAAIVAVEAAGQAKVDLAEQQAERVEDIIQEAEQDVLPELRQAIEDGIETKDQLEGSIQEAGETKTALDGSISSAGTAKGELDGTIDVAGQVKSALDESIATGDLDSFKADYMQFKNDSTLKSAKTEKELNDYKATMQQINIHQSPTQKASGHGIVSLPPNAAEGQISVVIKGNTISTVSAFRIRSVSEDESQESVVYVLAKDEDGNIEELRSLPNGTKDEISVSEGKLIKRVSDEIDVSKLTWSRYPTDGGWDTANYYSCRLIINDANYIGATGGNTWKFNNYGGSNTTIATTARDTDGLISYSTLASNAAWFYLKIPKSAYVGAWTLAETQAYLAQNQITLIYQLATPVELPVQVSGTLIGYPSGTVYIEPFVADAGIYTDKMSVLHQDLPIKALEKISKVDFEIGVEIELNPAQAIIAADKLSFTHPNLTSGDIVFFVYEHGAEGTIPETEISYYDSRYVIKGEDDKFYQWEIEAKLVEGVITPSIKLVEV